MVKRYEELTISDDFMFGKTMGDKVLCQDVLEQLLEEKVGELEDVQPQREFRYTSGGKPIRLDIYTRDKKRMYDAEMQNQNHQPVEKLELPKRSRFYQSTMDTDHLSKGKSYRELPEGRVLFICTFDPFGRGYAKYSFQNLCKEDRELYLKDGTEKIFYNCAADPEKVPENLRELYDYIRSGKVGGDLSQRIDEAVRMARKNEEWRSEYMKELLHDDDVREEGRAEGRAEGAASKMIEQIMKKYKKGCSVAETADMLEENPSVIEQIYDILRQNAPDYDVQKIYQSLLKKNTQDSLT